MSEQGGNHMDPVDDMVLRQLSSLFDLLDPPPEDLANEILMALSMATLDAELATMADEMQMSLRSDSTTATDTVTFTSSALQLMVSATQEGGLLRIDGWVTGGGLDVELMAGSTTHVARSDVHGRLVWNAIPSGPMRFLIHPDDGDARPVLTPVIEL